MCQIQVKHTYFGLSRVKKKYINQMTGTLTYILVINTSIQKRVKLTENYL